MLLGKMLELAHPNTFTEFVTSPSDNDTIVQLSFGKIISIRHKNENVDINIIRESNEPKLKFELSNGGRKFTAEYEWPPSIFKLFLPTFYKWMVLKARVKRFINRSIKIEKQIQERTDNNEFNRAYYSSFPEEIDGILLEKDDD